MVKRTPNIVVLCILFYLQFKTCLNVCAYNPKCYDKCLDLICDYDPSSNSFYNASLLSSPGNNHGPRCCQGCAPQYSMDHQFIYQTGDCYKGQCLPGHDYNGNLLYYMPWGGCSKCYNQQSHFGNFYMNIYTRECNYYCSNEYFRDNSNSIWMCVKTCPDGKYANPSSRSCQYLCNQSIQYNYAQNISFNYINQYYHTCQSVCSGPYFGDQDTDKCHQECPDQKLKHYPTKMCVRDCPDGYFISRILRSCVSHCYNQAGQFYNSLSNQCSNWCPSLYYRDNISGICLTNNRDCPPGMYKIQSSITCVKNCAVSAPNSTFPDAVYNDEQNMKCVTLIPYITIQIFIIVEVVVFVLILLIMGGGFYCYHKRRRTYSLKHCVNTVSIIP